MAGKRSGNEFIFAWTGEDTPDISLCSTDCQFGAWNSSLQLLFTALQPGFCRGEEASLSQADTVSSCCTLAQCLSFTHPSPDCVSLSLSLAQTKHFLVWTCCWGCSFAVTETKHRHKLTSLLQTLILLRSRSHSQSPVYLSLSLYCLDSTSES